MKQTAQTNNKEIISKRDSSFSMSFDPAEKIALNSDATKIVDWEPKTIRLVENGEGTTEINLSFQFNGYDDVLSVSVPVTVDLPESNKLLDFTVYADKLNSDELLKVFIITQQTPNSIKLLEHYHVDNGLPAYIHNYISVNDSDSIIYLSINNPVNLDESDSVLSISIYIDTGADSTSNINNIKCSDISFLELGPTVSTIEFNQQCIRTIDLDNPNAIIADGWLNNCINLTAIKLPPGLTTINENMFNYTDKLSVVSIPKSVTDIPLGVFNNCINLSEIIVDADNKSFSSINNLLCDKNLNKILLCPINIDTALLSDIIIPALDSLSIINEYAFANVRSITELSIPDNIKTIGQYAFYNTPLEQVYIPDTISVIETFAFDNCKMLKEIIIPRETTKIEKNAFSNCTNLSSIEFNNKLTDISANAFYACKNLISVVLPNSLKNIDANAFSVCTNLSSITIGSGVTTIKEGAFSGCTALTEFIVSEDNTTFKSVNGLLLSKDGKTLIAGVNDEVVIPDTVSTINNNAFDGYYNILSTLLPDSVITLESNAFKDCINLSSITIGSGVTTIKEGAFSGCTALTEFIVSEDNTTFKSVNGLLLSKDGKTLIIGVNGNVVIPQGVTSIRDNAFNGCYNISKVVLNQYVCNSKLKIIFKDSYLVINDIIILDEVTTINTDVFEGCSSITSVIFTGRTLSEIKEMSGYPWGLDSNIIKSQL